MNIRNIQAGKAAVLIAALLVTNGHVFADEQNTLQTPSMERLDDQRYRIGEIIVDKNAGEFSVPGKVLHLTGPLEYLAVSRDGMKGYESLLELSATPMEFKLACILIGLDEKNSIKPRYQFDERKAEGQAVTVTIHWQRDGKPVSVSGANAMTMGDDVFEDDSWVYIGSTTSEDGQQFMADFSGTLIGFVHDPFSIIDHQTGAAIGAYGLLTANAAMLPPEGSGVSVSISIVRQ